MTDQLTDGKILPVSPAKPSPSAPTPAVPGWLGDATAPRRYGAMLGVGSLIGGVIDEIAPRHAGATARRVEAERLLHRAPDPVGATGLVRQWQAGLGRRHRNVVADLVDGFDRLVESLSPLPSDLTVDQRREVVDAYYLARQRAM